MNKQIRVVDVPTFPIRIGYMHDDGGALTFQDVALTLEEIRALAERSGHKLVSNGQPRPYDHASLIEHDPQPTRLRVRSAKPYWLSGDE